MNKKYIIIVIFTIFIFGGVLVSPVQATVGGPTYIYDFKYNPIDESVYYTKISESGRGCPPELIKISLVSGESQVVFSCSDGEKLSSASLVSSEINKITKDFKQLTLLNLSENNIVIDINFLNSENYSAEINELLRRNFNTSVYQNNKKVTDFTISGCKMEQPFIFAGYAIPGFDKKIVLLSSAISNCNEGGYTYETLNVVGGVDNLKKDYSSNLYKGPSALVPNEGSLVVYEADKPVDSTPAITPQGTEKSNSSNNPQNINFYLIGLLIVLVSILIGIILGRFFTKKISFDHKGD
jgi:hypothetical protein